MSGAQRIITLISHLKSDSHVDWLTHNLPSAKSCFASFAQGSASAAKHLRWLVSALGHPLQQFFATNRNALRLHVLNSWFYSTVDFIHFNMLSSRVDRIKEQRLALNGILEGTSELCRRQSWCRVPASGQRTFMSHLLTLFTGDSPDVTCFSPLPRLLRVESSKTFLHLASLMPIFTLSEQHYSIRPRGTPSNLANSIVTMI